MIPEWLIIVVGVAIAVGLAGPLIIVALAGLFTALCGILIGLVELIDRLVQKTGFYRWRHKRRIRTGYYRKRANRRRGR